MALNVKINFTGAVIPPDCKARNLTEPEMIMLLHKILHDCPEESREAMLEEWFGTPQ